MKFLSKILLLVLLVSVSFAQKFEATADRTTVGQNERFQVFFTFEGQSSNVSGFKPPSFEGFRVLSGPNQSTNMQIINGQVSSSITFSFILTPSNIGEFNIGKASVNYSGTKYETNPLAIKVVQGATTAQPQQSGAEISQEELQKNVFIIASADKRNVYQGEQVTVTYKLYTKLTIASIQIAKLPTYNGFWQEEIPTDNTINWEIEMYNGERFRTATIKRVALFPTKAGELTVTPFELNLPIVVKKRRTSNDFFDDFFNDSFFGRTETVDYTAKSNTLKINAEPLPQNNVPESFNGAVGDFNFTSQLDRTSLKANESLTLRFTITGSGNMQLLDLPKLTLPAGFEVYEPKSNLNINRGSKISGTKIIEYVIVPRVQGQKTIPAVEFSYFNPAKKQYVTTTSPVYVIEVEKGDGTIASGSGFSKEDIKLLNEDIRYIKTSSTKFYSMNGDSIIPIWFWLGLILPAFTLGGLLIYQSRNEKLSRNTQLLKSRKAEKLAKQRLKTAQKLMTGNESLAFYSEISLAMNGYLEDKLSIQKSEFSLGKALDKLSEKNISDDLKEKVKQIYEKCEFARFAPSSQNISAEKNLYDETIETIIKIESHLNSRRSK
jgi:hypothetical protein